LTGLDQYLIYDLPIPYKNLLINPIKMKNYNDFYDCVSCLLLDKNSVSNIEVISMSYLNYLLAVGMSEPLFLTALDSLLKLVLTVKTTDENGVTTINAPTEQDDIRFSEDLKCLTVKGELITSEDFDLLIDVICEQNQIEQIDESISKEVRDALEEAEKFKRRQSGSKMCSVEDRLVAIGISTGYTLDYLYDLSIRKFNKMAERIDHTLHYKIYLSSVMSGNMKMKDGAPLQHWMADLSVEDKNQNSKVDYGAYKEKMGDTSIDADELEQIIKNKESKEKGEI